LVEHDSVVLALAVSPDGKVCASVGVKDGLKVYDLKGSELLRGPELLANPRVVTFRSAEEVAVAGRNVVGLFTLAEGKVIWKVNAPPGKMATSIAVSSDKQLVAVGFENDADIDDTFWAGNVRIYDGATGEQLTTFNAHPGPVRAMMFVPERHLLATMGFDHSVRLWEPREKREVARYGHSSSPTAMSFSPDGKKLAIATDDFTGGVIRIWEVPAANAPEGKRELVAHVLQTSLGKEATKVKFDQVAEERHREEVKVNPKLPAIVTYWRSEVSVKATFVEPESKLKVEVAKMVSGEDKILVSVVLTAPIKQ
jgi:hypothetical protein